MERGTITLSCTICDKKRSYFYQMEEPWENGKGASVFLESSNSFVGASMNTRICGCVYFSSLLFFCCICKKNKVSRRLAEGRPPAGKTALLQGEPQAGPDSHHLLLMKEGKKKGNKGSREDGESTEV